jgi:hypothetical protein
VRWLKEQALRHFPAEFAPERNQIDFDIEAILDDLYAEAEKLIEVGRQLQLWADDLEEMLVHPSQSIQARHEPEANRSQSSAIPADARTRF